jgi:hypothetical protein
MKWFRSNIKHGSRLALFALAVQFALSFGHFHAIAAPAAHGVESGAAQSGVSYAGILPAPDAVGKPAQQAPSDHDSGHPNDACAICTVVAMANAVLFATPPVLPLPQAVEFLYLPPDAKFVRSRLASPSSLALLPPPDLDHC